jgi:hypothetical protein
MKPMLFNEMIECVQKVTLHGNSKANELRHCTSPFFILSLWYPFSEKYQVGKTIDHMEGHENIEAFPGLNAVFIMVHTIIIAFCRIPIFTKKTQTSIDFFLKIY